MEEKEASIVNTENGISEDQRLLDVATMKLLDLRQPTHDWKIEYEVQAASGADGTTPVQVPSSKLCKYCSMQQIFRHDQESTA